MSDRLYSSREAADFINPAIDVKAFKRCADRLGVPYHKIGRDRYYTAEAIQQVINGSLKQPSEGEMHLPPLENTSPSLRKAYGQASAERLRKVIRELREAEKEKRRDSRRGG